VANTVTINPSGINTYRVVLTAATTLNINAGYDGQTLNVIFQQDNTGTWVVTAGAMIKHFTTPTSTANFDTIQTFVYDALLGFWGWMSSSSLPS
jgi:hypothetical protein